MLINSAALGDFMLHRLGFTVCLSSMVVAVACIAPLAVAQSALPNGMPTVPRPTDIHSIKIIGKDTRRRVPEKYKDTASGVGLIINHVTGSSCTAFCVGKDLIASNAHCLERHPKRKLKYDLRDMFFYLMGDGFAAGRSELKWNNVGRPGEPRLSLLTDGLQGLGKKNWPHRDWAVARLWTDLCAGDVLKFADRKLLRSTRWLRRQRLFMIGYHGDLLKKHKRRSYTECKFLSFTRRSGRRTARHNCDGVRGSSGSPLFVQTRDGPRVVGINYGTRSYRKFRRLRSGKTKTLSRWVTNAAVIPTKLVERLDRFSSSQYISDIVSLVDFQKKLKKAGYFRGKTGERYVSKTRSAIFRMERKMKLSPLGIPTAELWARLN